MLASVILYNTLTTAALMLLMWKNPRFMMHDYPPEISAHIPPKTEQEKKGALLFGAPFLLILVLFPFIYGFIGKFSRQVGFIQNWLQIFILLFSFNLFDWLILDWLLFCSITPRFMVLPGTEGHPGYHNYRFHFIGFLKGSLFAVLGSLCFAGLIEGISALIAAW